MHHWLSDLLVVAARTVLPAVLIALVGQYFILRWQHRYWRLQRITNLQDETYRKAKSVLTSSAFFFERTISTAAAELAGEGTAMPWQTSELLQTLASTSIQDRQSIAELSQDVGRLFSGTAHAAAADAARSIQKLRTAVLSAASDSTPLRADVLQGLIVMQADAVVRTTNALDLMAREIGLDPWGPWWAPGRRPVFGRRKDDIPDELIAALGNRRESAPSPSGRSRRIADRFLARVRAAMTRLR